MPVSELEKLWVAGGKSWVTENKGVPSLGMGVGEGNRFMCELADFVPSEPH